MQSSNLKDTSTNVKTELMGSFDPMIQNYSSFGRGYESERIEALESELETIKSFLKERNTLLKFKEINDDLAEREIECFLLEMKEKNIYRISIFDIVTSLKLPVGQVERMMEKFEKEGGVSELNE